MSIARVLLAIVYGAACFLLLFGASQFASDAIAQGKRKEPQARTSDIWSSVILSVGAVVTGITSYLLWDSL